MKQISWVWYLQNNKKNKKKMKRAMQLAWLFFLAGVVGIEPTSKVLETSVLPLNYTPKASTKEIIA